MVEGAAEVLDQGALHGQFLRRGGRQPVGARYVDGQHLTAGALLGEPRGPSDQGPALGSAGQADHDPLARAPDLRHPVLAAVLLQILVDPVRHPQQRQLPQRGQIARPEVVGQGRVHLVRLVDVAVRHPPAQCLWRHVDQFDLVRPAYDLVRHGLRCRTPVIDSTTSPRDSRCWMLTVDITSMPAASSSSTSCQRLVLREPGTLVWASSSTRATWGLRASTASTSISVKTAPGTPAPCAPSAPGRAASPRCAAGRGAPRRPPRSPYPAPHAGAPRRAWRRSCRRPVPHRGRSEACRVPWPHCLPVAAAYAASTLRPAIPPNGARTGGRAVFDATLTRDVFSARRSPRRPAPAPGRPGPAGSRHGWRPGP